MAITWPSDLAPSSGSPELRSATRSGGRSVSGVEQRVTTGASYWEISYSFDLFDRAKVNAWRAFVARLRDGEEVDVKLFDMYRAGVGASATGALTADAALRATQVSVAASGLAIGAGQHFSIASRLYVVTEVVSVAVSGLISMILGDAVWSDSGTWSDTGTETKVLKFRPPLRAAASAGATVNFDALVCRCVLKSPDDGDLSLEMLRFGRPSLTFIESVSS